MNSNALPINIYLPLSYTNRTFYRDPNAKDDVLYVRRDALANNVEYKSVPPGRIPYSELPTLSGATLQTTDLTTFLTLDFSDSEYTHMMRKYAVITDVANELRYFAGKMLE